MRARNWEVVPPFDFSKPLRMSVQERFVHCLDRARFVAAEYQPFCDFPCVAATGGSEGELAEVEARIGVPLPDEYRAFLRQCRYLRIADGQEIGGLPHNGVAVTETPWVSDEHRADTRYLIFANYWMYADGDQLMFNLKDASHPVDAYLHDHGPLIERYAPSFSLALWRLVHEFDPGR